MPAMGRCPWWFWAPYAAPSSSQRREISTQEYFTEPEICLQQGIVRSGNMQRLHMINTWDSDKKTRWATTSGTPLYLKHSYLQVRRIQLPQAQLETKPRELLGQKVRRIQIRKTKNKFREDKNQPTSQNLRQAAGTHSTDTTQAEARLLLAPTTRTVLASTSSADPPCSWTALSRLREIQH